MTLHAISSQDLSAVVGGVSEAVCRAVGGTAGALFGATAGYSGFGPIVAGIAGGTNLLSAHSAAGAGLDIAASAASTVPGPVGAVAGAYTFGKIGSNDGALLCGYPLK
jgi:hypothetical protein